MSKMVCAILMTPQAAWETAQLWERLGAPGVTILNSVGYMDLKERLRQDDIPLFPSFQQLVNDEFEITAPQRFLFSVVSDQFDCDWLLDETEKALGAFARPHSGFAFVIPVLTVRGLRPHAHRPEQLGSLEPG